MNFTNRNFPISETVSLIKNSNSIRQRKYTIVDIITQYLKCIGGIQLQMARIAQQCSVTNVIYSYYTTKQKPQKQNPLKNKVFRSDEGVEDEKHQSEAVFPCIECGMLISCPGNHSELSSVQQMLVEHLQHTRHASEMQCGPYLRE